MKGKKRRSKSQKRIRNLRRKHPGRGVYIQTEYRIPNGRVVFTQKSISGRYGKKNRNRVREKPTEESVKKWQDKRAELNCFLLLEANFNPGDYFMRLSWPPKTKKPAKEVREDIKKWKKKLRAIFKKAGGELKMIHSCGRGKRGATHLHAVINALVPAQVIEEAWQDVVGTEACPYPSTNTRTLDRSAYWPKLAEYLVKNGLETFRSEDPIYRARYVGTRNLVKPLKTTKVVEADGWLEKATAKAGFRVDYERLYAGFGITGFPHQSYCQVKLGIDGKAEMPGGSVSSEHADSRRREVTS